LLGVVSGLSLFIAQSQGLACGTHEMQPERYPVFAKPQVNLKGMGLGSGIIRNETEFARAMSPGMMWMQLLEGPHVSTDCAVSAGEVKWVRHATGLVWREGMFKHWIIHASPMPELAEGLAAWIRRELPHYTGMINIETIGGRIIEAQIRFADQWCDMNGEGWLDAVAGLYADGVWRFDDSGRRDAYSVPLFAQHGAVPPHPPRALQDDIRARPGVQSLQITFHEGKPGEAHPMPPGGFRLAIVNCWDLAAGLQARRDLAGMFPGVKIILPE
jgi:hypothetical protein